MTSTYCEVTLTGMSKSPSSSFVVTWNVRPVGERDESSSCTVTELPRTKGPFCTEPEIADGNAKASNAPISDAPGPSGIEGASATLDGTEASTGGVPGLSEVVASITSGSLASGPAGPDASARPEPEVSCAFEAAAHPGM